MYSTFVNCKIELYVQGDNTISKGMYTLYLISLLDIRKLDQE